MYSIVRKLLFLLDAEKSHQLALQMLNILAKLGLLSCLLKSQPDPQHKNPPIELMGLTFPNVVGLAAGLDKNADYLFALSRLGFGFIEVGTVTPKPQPGNPRPRLFRLPHSQAIINRMGFNNKGIEYLLRQVRLFRQSNSTTVIGINIGKNLQTPVEKALDDYLLGLRKAYPLADYISVNISSPNTPGLRKLQFGEHLHHLLKSLKQEQQQLAKRYAHYVPLVVKIAPDLNRAELEDVADCLLVNNIDGVIATNTTLSRENLDSRDDCIHEQGGLSGKPLKEMSNQVVKQLAGLLHGKIPIIGVGGIFTAEDAREKLQLGADLVQIYSGFIYQGWRLIDACTQLDSKELVREKDD